MVESHQSSRRAGEWMWRPGGFVLHSEGEQDVYILSCRFLHEGPLSLLCSGLLIKTLDKTKTLIFEKTKQN